VSVPAGHPAALKTVTWTPEAGVTGAAFWVSPLGEGAMALEEAAWTVVAGAVSAPATARVEEDRAKRATAKAKRVRRVAMATGGSGGRSRKKKRRSTSTEFDAFFSKNDLCRSLSRRP